jgi:predicted nuclease of predicted toxin-antitoxin system
VKIKLDENIGVRGSELLAERVHNVSTVRDQKLSSAPDENIFAVCAAEDRMLITLDRDFGECFAFRQNRALASSFWTLAREQVRSACLIACEIF